MSPTGRPEGEQRSAQHEALPITPTGLPEGEQRSAQHEAKPVSGRSLVRALWREWALVVAVATTVTFLVAGKDWLADFSSRAWFALMLGWLFVAIMTCAFAVVRHADAIALRIGEPLGTLVLTLAMSGMEMMMIASVMYTGQGGASLARDTMMAIVMIVLNGLVGTCLLAGGVRYHEQTYNLSGANAFLAVLIPLSVFGLVLPEFTVSTPGPMHSPRQSAFLIVVSVALYGVFLAIQTLWHRDYFVSPEPAPAPGHDAAAHPQRAQSLAWNVVLLLAYVVPIVLLSKQIAYPIDYGISGLGAPPAVGGLIVAVLILAPESLAAVRAALGNQLQRSINLALGTALSTISLTIPAVLVIGLVTGRTIILGLGGVDILMLVLTLVVSMLTFAFQRTNVLLGAVHMLMFFAYLMLVFER
ncbi:MAG TPA: calcium:proton antiporter [Casimicrobiaceae bacterium]|nr:calcium:proton antiporter [Casimicrobiaceae bacterium]